MIVAVCAIFAASAQHPMVTLSHNGELSFFTDITALNSAVEKAITGDIIYLSDGVFLLQGNKLTIPRDKRISIVGNGYKSYIMGTVLVIRDINTPDSDVPLFDGVRMDLLKFDDDDNLLHYEGSSAIQRCWIADVKLGYLAGKNITYDKCYIENYENGISGLDPSYTVFKNSKVKPSSDTYRFTAINCNVYNVYEYPSKLISCIVTASPSGGYAANSPKIINSVLDRTITDDRATLYNCYTFECNDTSLLLDENMDCPLNLEELGYLGQDGTVVGIYGGEYPFSENPSLPSVDTANSSVEYDAENNKLKVNITVKAD